MKRPKLSFFQVALLSLVFFSSDFFLKNFLLFKLPLNRPKPLIDNLVFLRLVYNRGAAFGILKGKTDFLVLIGIIFIIILIIWIVKSRFTLLEKIFLSMILGGALSNLYDRIFLGAVIDYIDLKFWPVFNLSDSFISAGCLFFLMQYLREIKCRRKNL